MYRLVPAHIYISLCVFGWGLAASCQSLATSFGALVTLRALLGIAEAAFGPGVPFYLSLFYKREELAFRNGLFISAAPLATSFASSLAWLIVKLSSDGPIAPWRTLFLVEGFPSVIVAIFAWILIPDSPGSARFLNPHQRMIAQRRLEDNRAEYHGTRQGRFDWVEVRKALKDPKAYLTAVSTTSSMVFTILNSRAVHVLQLQRGIQLNARFSTHYYKRVSFTSPLPRSRSKKIQYGLLFHHLSSPFRAAIPRRLRGCADYSIYLGPEPIPKPLPYSTRSVFLHRLPSHRSHGLLPFAPIRTRPHLHPLSRRLPCHIRLLLRHYFNHDVDDGQPCRQGGQRSKCRYYESHRSVRSASRHEIVSRYRRAVVCSGYGYLFVFHGAGCCFGFCVEGSLDEGE